MRLGVLRRADILRVQRIRVFVKGFENEITAVPAECLAGVDVQLAEYLVHIGGAVVNTADRVVRSFAGVLQAQGNGRRSVVSRLALGRKFWPLCRVAGRWRRSVVGNGRPTSTCRGDDHEYG